MLLAYVDDALLEATADGPRRGTCPCCAEPVVAKTGELVAWHWAHRSKAGCDPWSEGETDWHLGWKRLALAGGARVEVPMRDEEGDVVHRADIVLEDGTVVEVQRSRLSPDEVADREWFYSRHGGLRWVFHAEVLGWWTGDARDRSLGAYREPVPDWLLRRLGGDASGLAGQIAFRVPPMLAVVRAPMVWDLPTHGDPEHPVHQRVLADGGVVPPRLAWADGVAHVGRWGEWVVRLREATRSDALAPGGPVARVVDNRVPFRRPADERLPVEVTAFTAEGLPRRANDWVVLRAVPCEDCGAGVWEACRRWTGCPGRTAAAHAVLAVARRSLLRVVA
jgi:hypothetical protein